jgi:predicted RNA-binding protein with PUA-like domain
VDVRAIAPFPKHVTLGEIKETEALADMALVKNSRLSVQPVTDAEWELVCKLGGYSA